jgi:hypothetical protein
MSLSVRMTGPLATLGLAGAAAAVVMTPSPARAQSFASEPEMVETGSRFRSPQRFAFELRFGPYRPNVDGEFNGSRTPYKDYFGDSRKLMTQIELDYEFFHRFGSLGIGLGVGYFSVSGTAPVADGTGAPSGDRSTLKVVPMALSLVYRFDVLLERRKFPIVPYGKAGVDYAYWQITDGSDQIATDGKGGSARGGTPGWHAAAGVALVLDGFDPEAARSFDSDMGVNHTAIVFEYRYADISGLGSANKLHVGDTTWSLGLLLEF